MTTQKTNDIREGDTVVCVSAVATYSLVEGEEYRVLSSKSPLHTVQVTVEGVAGWWDASRFRKVEPPEPKIEITKTELHRLLRAAYDDALENERFNYWDDDDEGFQWFVDNMLTEEYR